MSGSIATRTGDDGSTSLLYGQRVPKDHPQIEAVGAYDELNVALGAVKPLLADATVRTLVSGLQNNLVALMGEVACAEADAARYAESKFAKISAADVTTLDALALEECRGLFARVVGPGDVLWDLHFEVCRQVLAVGGGVPVDELAEWVAVYRAAEAEAAELAASVPAVRGPSWIETALAEVEDDADVGV
jgi:cob(I)alamin adenosyltransferase